MGRKGRKRQRNITHDFVTSIIEDSFRIPDIYSCWEDLTWAELLVITMVSRYHEVGAEDIVRVAGSPRFGFTTEEVETAISHLLSTSFLVEALDDNATPCLFIRGWRKKHKLKTIDPVTAITKRLGYCPILWVCFYCGRPGTPQCGPDGRTWHADHSYPRALGGDDYADNMVLTCASCNLSKRDTSASEFFERLRVASDYVQ